MTCSGKTYYYTIWDSLQRGYIPNFIFTTLILNEILVEIVYYPLVNPVNTKGTCSEKTYYYTIWNGVHRGYIPNFILIASILTEILAEIVKLTHSLSLLTLGGQVKIKPITTISEVVFREPAYQITMS